MENKNEKTISVANGLHMNHIAIGWVLSICSGNRSEQPKQHDPALHAGIDTWVRRLLRQARHVLAKCRFALLVLAWGVAWSAQAYESTLAISPPAPTDKDLIAITAQSFCIGPINAKDIAATVADGVVRVDLRLTCGGFLTEVVRDTVSVGPLSSGVYRIELWVTARGDPGSPFLPPILLAISSFTVAATTATVQEFHHSDLNHYFITADPAEAQTLLDHTQPGWTPTGQSYKAMPATAPVDGETAAVCRFYGSVAPGPNSHFHTLFADECAALKALQQSTPASVPRWNYEGIAFAATLPQLDGTCPSPAPLPVRRFYNQRALQNDSNHRYVTDPATATDMRAKGWGDEGIVMCATPAP